MITALSLGFDDGLDGWRLFESGGSPQGRGSVVAGSALLREGDSFLVGLDQHFTVPADAVALTFTYTDLRFDVDDPDSINDAFEAVLVDEGGTPLVHAFAPGRDAFFNATEDLPIARGQGTQVDTGADGITTVTVDITGLHAGTQAVVGFRLVNNDGDTETTVHILDVAVTAESSDQAPQLEPIGDIQAEEGDTIAVTARFTDADAGDSHTAVVAWGDGTSSPATVVPQSGGGSINADHVYADDGTYEATLTVTDAQGASASERFTVTVENAAPTVNVGFSFEASTAGDRLVVVLRGDVEDAGFDRPDAQTTETFTIRVAWDDGSTQDVTPTLIPGAAGTPTTGRFEARHTYANPGIYAPRITVRDDDGGTDAADLLYGVAGLEVTRAIDLIRGGSVPVLVGRDPGFDATRIVPTTVRFGPAGATPANGVMQVRPGDVRFNFNVLAAGFRPNSSHAILTGELSDGMVFGSLGPITVTGGSLPATSNPGATKFFVVDAQADTSFRYGANGSSNGGYGLDAVVKDPRGVASTAAGDRVWVVDGTTHAVAIQGPDGSVVGSWRAAGLVGPQDLATDGTDLWVVDDGTDRVLRYAGAAAQTTGTAYVAASFALHAANARPSGLATDGKTLWVTDEATDEVFVYDREGTLLGRWGLDAANTDPSGITNDAKGGADLWVVDRADRRVYHYAGATSRTSGVATATGSFALAAGNVAPEGIADPPPSVEIATPAGATGLPAGSQVLLSGTAERTGTAPGDAVTHVTVNGVPVEVLDAAGHFFARVPVAPGDNVFQVEAFTLGGESADVLVTVRGADPSAAPDLAALDDLSGSLQGVYGRTSFRGPADVLYADLAIRNGGGYGIGAPLLVGITNLSDPTCGYASRTAGRRRASRTSTSAPSSPTADWAPARLPARGRSPSPTRMASGSPTPWCSWAASTSRPASSPSQTSRRSSGGRTSTTSTPPTGTATR